MTPATGVSRGVRTLRLLLREWNCDVRNLDPAEFRGWLARQLRAWRCDPVFRQRVRIRELRRAHPELRELERKLQGAVQADEAAPGFERRRQIERELCGVEKAIEGVSEAIDDAVLNRRKALRTKLAQFRAKRRSLVAERRALTRDSAEHHTRLRVARQLRDVRCASGIEHREMRLQSLLRARGRRGGRAGAAFEARAMAATRKFVFSDLKLGRADGVHVLTAVTLGAAKVEWDLLVVREETARLPVAVLAAVEAKRNINDLAHGFRRRQEDLAWLTGAVATEHLSTYRTRAFPSGRFDRDVVHVEDGNEFRFGPDSFRLFRRDPATGLFLERLYLVTRRGPLFGVASSVLARLSHRIASDERWNPADPNYLDRLREWCHSHADPVETPDVVRLYAAQSARARRLIVFAR